MSLSAIEGIVSTIRFRKEETGFTVLTLIPENQREGIVCAGVFPSVEKGDPLRVYGKWDNNPKYGLQLKCKY
ncbi:MAG: YrrC family ATP-dependent DNA helicase, partial [Chitinivibrionales bacterium]